MKISKKAALSGVRWALFIALALVFLPPLLLGFLPVWPDAKDLSANDKRLLDMCKSPANVELSRWFYTYKFSGESGDAVFSGQVVGVDCEKRFRVRLKKKASVWAIDQIIVSQ